MSITFGRLSANDEVVEIDCAYDSSAIISVSGTFSGTITVTGCATDEAPEGGRLLFESGVGSVGRNYITVDGEHAKEYRVAAGGTKLYVRASNWTSGTAEIYAHATNSPSLTFVNGPVHSAEEEAIRNQRGFAASTGPQSVPIGNVMVQTLKNPSDSGRNVYLRRRRFDNDVAATGDNLEYIAYASPTYEPTNTQNGINLNGATPYSAAEFKWEVRSITGLVIGGSLGTGEILPRGAPYLRDLDFVLKPGFGVGFVLQGQGNNITQAVRTSITLEWYEETA